MRIIDAISRSIKEIDRPANYKEIYEHIEKNGYFKFGAEFPASVVRNKLRLHSDNINIASGRGKEKLFHSTGGEGVNETYTVLDNPIPAIKKLRKREKNKGSVVKTPSFWQKRITKAKNFDWSIHRTSCIECFWMLLGCFLPIIFDSFLRVVLLKLQLDEAVRQNLKGGEVFLLTSALIMPFCFVIIRYMGSDEEGKKENKLPYFGVALLCTVISLITGIFTFIYYRIGQIVKDNAESEVVKTMFSYDFGSFSIGIFLLSLFVWYYSSYMNHRSSSSYKKIRAKQQTDLEEKYIATEGSKL